MKDIIKYISIIASLCVFFSCSLKEDFVQNETHSVEYVARLTGFNNVDVATKSAPTEEFETAVYTAYFLLFDNSTGDRIAFESIDVSSGSLSQTVIGKAPESGLACFIANVSQEFANGLTTIDALNSAVLNITYATYSEAGGYLGVPKLTVNDESKLCIPMFGSVPVTNLTNGGNIEIPVKRLFAKISMNIKMQLTNVGLGQIVPTTVNYELNQYQLYNLPTKVHLVGNVDDDETYESDWVGNKSAFYANATTPLSSNSGLGLQTINISDSDSSTDNNSDVVTGIEFCLYVPEYYLLPKRNDEITNDQKYKPQNYDKQNKNAIYVELVGEVNQSLIDNTTIHHNIFLGEDNTDNYTLKRNLNYINQITIKGIDNNDKGTGDNLDHRVTTEVVNNPVAQAGKAANCYIIAKPGEYTIPAYKGAYNNLNGATLCMAGKNMSEYETQVAVLANVVEYQNITSITFSVPPTYDPETNTISFTVNSMLTDNWVPNGSVIMALQYRRKGETTWTTEWSWHLWFVYNATGSEDGWGTIGYQSMPDGVNNMMDRNLGVHASALTNAGAQVGFYYKYGEHAPYLDPDGDGVYTQFGGGSVSNSTPTWNVSGKSVTDPCPPGYKVPSASVFSASVSPRHEITYTAFAFWDNNSSINILDDIYFPYSGEVQSSNNKVKTTESASRSYTTIVSDELELGAYMFTNIHYPALSKTGGTYGIFATINPSNYIQYLYTGLTIQEIIKNLTPEKLDYKEGEWISTGLFSGYYHFPDQWTTNVQYSSLSRTAKAAYQTIKTLSSSAFSNLYGTSIIANYAANTSNGYQVRCVKE